MPRRPSAGRCRSPAARAPPSVTASMLTVRLTGIDGRIMPLNISANACVAASGSRRGVSGVAISRSRSICRADSAPCSRGRSPNLISAAPSSLAARSSGPYWNSTCSSSADCALALTLLAQPPRLVGDRPAARLDRAGRPRQRQRAVEPRRAAVERRACLRLRWRAAARRSRR